MEEILIIQTNIYPFNLLIVSMLIDPDFLKNIVNIARPIAASAAATTKITMSVIFDPLALISVKAACPGVSINVMVSFFSVLT